VMAVLAGVALAYALVWSWLTGPLRRRELSLEASRV
jgi:hypothetical protein